MTGAVDGERAGPAGRPPGVLAVRFVGVRTERFVETVAVYRDALGLDLVHEAPGVAWFALGDGAQVHVYGPPEADHAFLGPAPCVGYLVEDFAAARAALIATGCSFAFGPPQVDADAIWNHYRAPDGNVYEIIGRQPLARS